MNRRELLRVGIGAAGALLAPAPLMALAPPEPDREVTVTFYDLDLDAEVWQRYIDAAQEKVRSALFLALEAEVLRCDPSGEQRIQEIIDQALLELGPCPAPTYSVRTTTHGRSSSVASTTCGLAGGSASGAGVGRSAR